MRNVYKHSKQIWCIEEFCDLTQTWFVFEFFKTRQEARKSLKEHKEDFPGFMYRVVKFLRYYS